MGSDRKYMDFVMDQLSEAHDVSCKSMFGEYGLYSGGKFFGMVCDNKLFIKTTKGGESFIGDPVMGSPYPGAKPIFLIEDKLDDRAWLAELIKITVMELPDPKPRKNRARKG